MSGIGGFGSINNHFSAIGTLGAPEPVVGMGCTQLCWTDRHPYTVIAVVTKAKTKKTEVIDYIVVQEDGARRTDGNGMSECQSYEFSRNPQGATRMLKRNKRNQWVEVKDRSARPKSKDVQVYRMGDRSKYHDFSH
jgi:hypothetical protein